ncbi:unnamed protein product [Owenia fusiformis]|uniref:Uncharacterized protein n=1 Tax=Owenia fusiformis TaxID=6347 RepID=A0A8J1UC40_OWEFU|nr:unnamed protein product [Owenia fusiformis]
MVLRNKMASCGPPTQDERFREILTCPICLEQFTDPKVLPCLHTFCLGCVDTWATKHQNGTKLPCPVCKEEMDIPDGGLKAIKPNFLFNTLHDALSMSKDGVTDEQFCDICCEDGENVKAEKRCMDCDEHLCQNCTKLHLRMKSSRHHKMILLTGDVAKDVKHTIAALPERSVYCEKHPQEVLKYFCKDDSCVICSTCYVTTHSGHSCSDVVEEGTNVKERIAKLLKTVESKITTYCDRVKQIQESKQNEVDDLKREISNEKEKFMKHVENYYDKQLTKVCELWEQTVKKIEAFGQKTDDLKETKQFLETLEDHGHITEVIRFSPEVDQKSEELNDERVLDTLIQDVGLCIFQPGEVESEQRLAMGKLKEELEGVPNQMPDEQSNKEATALLPGAPRDQEDEITSALLLKDFSWISSIKSMAVKSNGEIAIIRGEFSDDVQVYEKSMRDLNNGNIAAVDEDAIFRINGFKSYVIDSWRGIKYDNPIAMAVNSQDEVVLIFGGRGNIVLASLDGDENVVNCWLKEPKDICVDASDNIIIADTGNKTVQVRDSKGKLISKILKGVECTSVAITNEGNLLCGTDDGKIYKTGYI